MATQFIALYCLCNIYCMILIGREYDTCPEKYSIKNWLMLLIGAVVPISIVYLPTLLSHMFKALIKERKL